MKRVLLIAYYFPPLGWSGVQRTLKYIKHLREFDWEPTVVTVSDTKFSVRDESLFQELPKDIEVIRLPDVFLKGITDQMLKELLELVKPAYDLIEDKQLKTSYLDQIQAKIAELRNMLLLPDGNIIWAKNVIDKINQKVALNDFDIIYSTSGPYSDHIIGFYLKKECGLPWVADFRDEWTNNSYYNFTMESIRYQVEKHLENKIVLAADQIITVSPVSTNNYQQLFKVSTAKMTTIPNGYDEEDFLELETYPDSDRFSIIHNGSFYLQRNPYTFLEALENLIQAGEIDEEKVLIEFIGIVDDNIKAKVNQLPINRLINWAGYLTHQESLAKALQANLLLLVIGPGEKMKSICPGKIFEYLRLGKPILSLSPTGSVVDQLLQETGHGNNVEYDDMQGIEKLIIKKYRDWLAGKKLTINRQAIRKYERRYLTQQLAELFDSLIKY